MHKKIHVRGFFCALYGILSHMSLHVPDIELFVPEESKLFQISMWWRIIYGILRVILGITFLRLIGVQVSEFVYIIMSHELTQGVNDIVFNKIYFLFEKHDFTIGYFIAGYFIFWGCVDIFLSLSLLHKVRIAYPISIGLIGVFILYSTFRFSYTHSVVLLGVIGIDIIILYLIYREYKKLKPISKNSTLSGPLHHQS